MPRLLAALSVPTLFLALSTVPGAEPREKEFFATRVGDRWVYRVTTNAYIQEEVTEVVTGVEQEGGETVVSVGREAGGKVNPHAKMRVSADGLVLVAADGRDLDPPMPLLKLRGNRWDTWEWDLPAKEGVRTRRVNFKAEGDEGLRVPAGRYKAKRVYSETTDGAGGVIRVWSYYAQGVGLVREVSQRPRTKRVTVLKSFTPGKD